MSNSITAAPEYGQHRKNVTAVDSGDITDKRRGMNCGSYRVANVQIVPLTVAGNPTVEILFWSEKAGKFIRSHTALTRAGVGAGVSYERRSTCLHR